MRISDWSSDVCSSDLFWNGPAINLGPFYYIFAAFVIVGAGNAVNLTDGLDGLATMPVIIASVAFMLIAYIVGRADYATYLGIPHVPGAGDLTILIGAIIYRKSVVEGKSVSVRVKLGWRRIIKNKNQNIN